MSKYIIEVRWAIIFFVAQLAWIATERLVGLHDQYIGWHPIFTNFFGIVAILIYILALLEKRKEHYEGKMTFRQGFMTGLVVTIIMTVLSPIAQYLTSSFISPDYFGNAIAYAVIEGEMTQEAAEAMFNFDSYLIQATFGALMMGILTTAIVAYFIKKN